MRPMPLEPSGRSLSIGPRVREARIERGLTIEEVARVAGLTKGFLSRIERDIVSPSVSTLVTLCEVLSISVGSLFTEPEVKFVAAGTGPRVNLGGIETEERLVTPREEARVQVLRSVISTEGRGATDLYAVAADVDVLHVLRGRVRVEFTSEQAWELGPGDTLTFNGHEPHNWSVIGDEAEVIWVLVPAIWSS
ncbi:XRE family transcriptional regulator [Agromyces mediolanus]|uniref:helix-turn-helix domain-containing protein n=1 Tax=Agromyces mediolanus TaxID=41986 RepID=UPI00203C175C|nr:XRE family transcriptional regulator [Agromyces mediolanus]MCM3658321.1 XRE family transcriptional regulator [Agromyces mediolanus]